VEDQYVRAVRGGVGEAKTGGNYAASQMATKRAKEAGYAQVLWLDAIERRYVEEMGGMNVFFVYGNKLVTSPLTGTILPGITRDSILILGRDLGYEVEEAMIDINDLMADIKAGKVTEAFACGTAAVIAPIGLMAYKGEEVTVNDGGTGNVTQHLYDELTGIQYGRIPDRFGWTLKINAD
jgi:branched-chain amino acid aminotransferase